MRQQPVVVAHPSLYKRFKQCAQQLVWLGALCGLLLLSIQPLRAAPFDSATNSRYLAELRVRSVDELQTVLKRAEQLVSDSQQMSSFDPVVFVLHGDEAEVVRQSNFSKFQDLIGLAARLDAKGVIDVRVCETWMRVNMVTKEELPEFIDTVPFGPAEEASLIRKGYLYF